MNRLAWTLFLAWSVAIPAYAGDASMPEHGMKESGAAAHSPFDLQYLDTMAAHHQSAVDMAKLASGRSHNAQILAFAKSIIQNQNREIAQFHRWRASWFPGKPRAVMHDMPGMQESMAKMDMGKLKAARGTEFDRLFLTMMIPHHQGAIDMSRPALGKFVHPELKAAADKIITLQQKEIEQMKTWQAQLG